MVTATCYRELTKKVKFKGLSFFSWIILGAISFFVWIIFILWAIHVAIGLYGILFLCEYFDEDIYEIIAKNHSIKSSEYYN